MCLNERVNDRKEHYEKSMKTKEIKKKIIYVKNGSMVALKSTETKKSQLCTLNIG